VQEYDAILDDIMGVDFVFRSPTPDPISSRLAYVHAASQGRGLYILDLATQQRSEVPITNEVTQVNGWSPDGRYLAFVQAGQRMAQGKVIKEEWATLFDSREQTVQRLTDKTGVVESYFFWLSTNTFFFVSRGLKMDYAEIFMGSLESRDLRKVSNYRYELVVMGERLAGHLERGNIFSLEIKPLKETDVGTNHSSRTVRQLTDFKPGDFDVIKWLRYSRETGRFLFCARPTNSTWRYLYQFDPSGGGLKRLNDEDTYNGQWLQDGSGFAYVGNTNNNFYLAVRPQDPTQHTNLFLSGSVVNYQVAPDGNHLFATASIGVEPQGLWAYSLTNRALRRVVDGLSVPFVAAKIIEPLEYRVKSFDGLGIPCYRFGPASHWPGNKTPARQSKRPAVIFLSPRTGQFQRSFDARAQLLANLGFHFVAVNYRGCDGYGRDYASLGNAADAAKDILAVHGQLVSDPTVDRKNVFLSSSSDGSVVAYEVLARAPGLWRAVALENPTAPVFEGRFNGRQLPPVFFATGDQDGACSTLRQFQVWGQANGAAIKSVIYTNAGHITYKSAERKDKLRNVSQFFLEHLQ
jgi:dipeptidyl aminopeptidase/acylaminoacyl peptidase